MPHFEIDPSANVTPASFGLMIIPYRSALETNTFDIQQIRLWTIISLEPSVRVADISCDYARWDAAICCHYWHI